MDGKLDFTARQKAMLAVAGACVFCVAGLILLTWQGIPEKVPTHYGVNGKADAWGGKSVILVLLGFEAGLYLIMTAVAFFPSAWNIPIKLTGENRTRV